MISSQTRQYVADFDELVREDDPDFAASGLKVSSVIRVGRLAVVTEDILLGAMGEIKAARLARVKKRLVEWFTKP